jgi:hypothetical protein
METGMRIDKPMIAVWSLALGLWAGTALADMMSVRTLPHGGPSGLHDSRNVSAIVLRKSDPAPVGGPAGGLQFARGESAAPAVDPAVDTDRSPATRATGEQTTALQSEEAASLPIGQLPKAGKVAVAGRVDAVKSDRSFTLKDDTGTVRVRMKTAVNPPVSTGRPVTVVGYVNNGVFGIGRKIEATQIVSQPPQPPVSGLDY